MNNTDTTCLNTEEGISHTKNNETVYREILRTFSAELQYHVPRLKQMAHQNLSLFTVSLHNLKKSSDYLGMERLTSITILLEHAGQAGDMKTINQLLPGFMIEIQNVLCSIDNYLS